MATVVREGYGLEVDVFNREQEAVQIKFWQQGVADFEPIKIDSPIVEEEVSSLVLSRFYEVGLVGTEAEILCSTCIMLIQAGMNRFKR